MVDDRVDDTSHDALATPGAPTRRPAQSLNGTVGSRKSARSDTPHCRGREQILSDSTLARFFRLRNLEARTPQREKSAMNGVNVRVVGSKIGVKVHILKVIAEGVGGGRPISPRQLSAGRLLLSRDDLILDLVVGRLRHDLLLHQLVLPLVRPAVHDLLGVGVADAR